MDIACNTVNGNMIGNGTTAATARLTPPTRCPPNQKSSMAGGGKNSQTVVATTTSGSSAVTSTAGAVTTTANSSNKSHQIPSDILDDLACRFIINVPDDERKNLIRICFQIELAHWFYLDFFCEQVERKLVTCGVKQFAVHLFQHIPFLREHLSTLDEILDVWKNYKLTVPTYGAILVSEDLNHVLLVQSYWAKSSWGFPKGKVNEFEDPVHCAAREVFEETGYDIAGQISPNDYIDANMNYQYIRLYIVRNVPLHTQFLPRTRKEIKSCEWFPIDSLPINKNHAISKQTFGINANSFFMIMPFMKRLKKWINDNRSGIENNNNNNNLRKISTSTTSSSTSPIQFTNNKDIENNMRIYNDNIALQNNKNTIGGNGNNNTNNGNNNKKKRQRHKSMGDIDGIKLILSNNTNNNCKLSSGGTKTTNNNNQTTPNSATVMMHSENDTFWGNNNNTNNTQSATKRSEKANNNNSNKSNMLQNSKRQLFNGKPSDEGCRKSLSSFDLIRKEKQQQQQQQVLKNGGAEKAAGGGGGKKPNGGQQQRTRTKSQSQPQQQPPPQVAAPSIASVKPKVQKQKSSPPVVVATAFSTLSLSSSVAAVSATTTANQILKFNPNFDSWTNFSFTKNFIANVFC